MREGRWKIMWVKGEGEEKGDYRGQGKGDNVE